MQMFKREALVFLGITVLLLLAACEPPLESKGSLGGVISGSYVQAFGDATLTITGPDGKFSCTVAIPDPDGVGFQSADYALADVPMGTYSVTIKFNFRGATDPRYSFDGSSYTAVSAIQSEWVDIGMYYALTVTIDAIEVSGDNVLKLDLTA